MRLLVLGLNYAPDVVGIAKYTGEMAEWLASRGHEIRVVTAPPYYPAWRLADRLDSIRYRRELRAGVPILRCPIYVPSVPTGGRRVVHLTSFAISSFPAVVAEALTFRPHLIFVVAPALVSAVGALVAARASGAKSWLHVQDFEVDAAFELDLLQGRLLRRLAFGAERTLLRGFDHVSAISPQMVSRLLAKGCTNEQVYELRNWADTQAIRPVEGLNSYRRELGLQADDVLVLYSGTIARKQGLELVIEAARSNASSPRLHFLICGDGPGRAELEARAIGLENVRFLPLQPLSRLNELLCAADIHLLPQVAGAADLVLPSKLTGMLASGRPVIATAAAGTGLATEVEGCGVAVKPGDLQDLLRAITALAADRSTRARLGAAARRRAEAAWSLQTVLTGLEAKLRATINFWSGTPATQAVEP